MSPTYNPFIQWNGKPFQFSLWVESAFFLYREFFFLEFKFDFCCIEISLAFLKIKLELGTVKIKINTNCNSIYKTTEQSFKINSVNAEWFNIQSCINCKSLLMMSKIRLHSDRTGTNTIKYVPKSGFINVFDYKNPQELGNYLKYLDQNKTAYNSYFKWKKYVLFKHRYQSSNLCDMCLMLNLENEMPIRRNIIKGKIVDSPVKLLNETSMQKNSNSLMNNHYIIISSIIDE
ncbi:Glyco 3-alpha-L-fucosyltransferase A [Brachionus plicatilis]|uniref:Fucosyltransferase n=1 Tax=Brachionus plicatilis TaxID=10195 RepID=A0A3M7PW84_BRAPC|nr:Glyco 3-alpha-L-fucosyltransferase A [Brachionus plicatilis]